MAIPSFYKVPTSNFYLSAPPNNLKTLASTYTHFDYSAINTVDYEVAKTLEPGKYQTTLHYDGQTSLMLTEEQMKAMKLAYFGNEHKLKKPRMVRQIRTVSKKMSSDRNAGRLMRKAADIMEDRGWTRGAQLNKHDGSMCILGSLHFAACGNAMPRNRNAIVERAEMLFRQWSGEIGIPTYNDHKAKDKDEILETMRKFANEFDPQGDMR